MDWTFLKQAGFVMEVSADDRNNTVTVAVYLHPKADFGFKVVRDAFQNVEARAKMLDRDFEKGALDVHADPAKLYPEEGRISVTLHLTLGVTKASKEAFNEALEAVGSHNGFKRKYF